MKKILLFAVAAVLLCVPSCRKSTMYSGIIEKFSADSVYVSADDDDGAISLPAVAYKISAADRKKVDVNDYIYYSVDQNNVLHSPKLIHHVVFGTIDNSNRTSIAVISSDEGTLVIDMPEKPNEDFERFKVGDFVIVTCEKRMEKGKMRYLATSLGVLHVGMDAVENGE